MKKIPYQNSSALVTFFFPLSVHKKKGKKEKCAAGFPWNSSKSNLMKWTIFWSQNFSVGRKAFYESSWHDSRTQLTSSNRPFFFFNYKPCPKGLDYYFIIQTAPVMKCRIAELGHMGTARNGEPSSKWFEILESKWYNGLGWCWQPP